MTTKTSFFRSGIFHALSTTLLLLCTHCALRAAPASTGAVASAIAKPIGTVMDKGDSPVADKHTYVSYARYYWPDPKKPNGLPYVSRDGNHNMAQVARGDHARLWALFGTVETLADAWRANRDEAAARRAGEWLRAWFVTPGTRMNPNLDYAQVRLGHNNNRGSAAGVIDARGFGRIVQHLKTLDDSPALTDSDKTAIRVWFNAYLDWMLTSKIGTQERVAKNNHGTWYIAQVLPIATYLGRDKLARELCDEAKSRIAAQIEPHGKQPEETRRVDGLHYSYFNLEAYSLVAQAAAPLGVDLWNYTAPNGASLGKALDFLAPYNRDPSTWPHNQKAKMSPGFLDWLLKERDNASRRS